MPHEIAINTRTLRRAEFELWLPPAVEDKVQKPAGIIVLSTGSNGDGRGYVWEDRWQAFAIKHNMPLVGTFFQDKDPSGIEGYCKAGEESGEALLWALHYFSEVVKIDLETPKLYLYGFSAGGQFNYEMNAYFPSRVGAFVVNKGGIYYSALVCETARKTPGIFFVGKRDAQWRQDIVKGLATLNRQAGAKWFIVQEDCAHSEAGSEKMSMTFFEKVLKGFGK